MADDDHKSGGGVPSLKDIDKVYDWRQQIGLYIMGKDLDPGVISMTDEEFEAHYALFTTIASRHELIKKMHNAAGKIGLAIEHDAAKTAWLDQVMVVRQTMARKACVLRECMNAVMMLTSEETIIQREEIVAYSS